MLNTLDILIDTQLLRSELSELRKSKHMTQSQVAEIAGLSKSTISNIESGEEKGVTLASIIKYTRAIDATLFVKSKDRGDKNE